MNIPLEGSLGWERGALQAQPWKNAEELLAMIAELIDVGNRNFFAANSKKGSRKPKPIKIERPRKSNEPEPVKRKATPEEVAAIFGTPRKPSKTRAE